MTLTIAAAQQEFDAKVTYLNTATLGLPPRRSRLALQQALTDWQDGTANPQEYDDDVRRARSAYGDLVSVDPALIACGSQASGYVGIVADWVPRGAEVLVAEGEFTSLTFPFLARGHRVREVPLEWLADEVGPSTALVAVSAVQSADGRVADLDGLRATGVPILLDTTQAIGWLPVDASQYAFTVAGGYKWMMTPRGTAFFTVQASMLDELMPGAANWYAGDDPWSSIYGSPLRLAPDARRFDLSPAWHAWVAGAPSLELLREVGTAALHYHAVGLARRFQETVGLEVPKRPSAIVSAVASPAVPALMESARIVGSVRDGRLRLAFHLSTSEADVEWAADVLRGRLQRPDGLERP